MFSWKSYKKPIIGLAPMAGFTDSPYRQICRDFGSDIFYSELISTAAFFYKQENEASLRLCRFEKSERPFILQLFGREPEQFLKAIEAVEKAGIKPDGIDINMGCPVKKVVKSGYGSALMKEPKQAAIIVKTLKKETRYPISIKTRSGWHSVTAPDFAKEMEQSGADAISIHARTYKQGFSGKADWGVIGKVKKAVNIPVLGNGDIKNVDDVYKMLRETGCDGVLIGRASLGNPWIFKDVKNMTETIKNYENMAEVLIRHINSSIVFYGEEKGLREVKKHYAFYLKGITDTRELRGRMIRAGSKNEVLRLIKESHTKSYIIES